MTTEPVPTYDEIIASRRPDTFPCWTLEGVQSALCCYAAAFYGRQDVAHLAAAWVPDVTCIDTNADKIAVMGGIYRDHRTWVFEHSTATRILEDEGVLDQINGDGYLSLVTLDPWTQDIPRVWREEVPLALAIAPRVVVGYCPHAFEHDGEIAVDVASIAPPGAKVEEILKRSDHRGGVYWVVLGR